MYLANRAIGYRGMRSGPQPLAPTAAPATPRRRRADGPQPVQEFCEQMKLPRASPSFSLRGRRSVPPAEIGHCEDFLALLRMLPPPKVLQTGARSFGPRQGRAYGTPPAHVWRSRPTCIRGGRLLPDAALPPPSPPADHGAPAAFLGARTGAAADAVEYLSKGTSSTTRSSMDSARLDRRCPGSCRRGVATAAPSGPPATGARKIKAGRDHAAMGLEPLARIMQ